MAVPRFARIELAATIGPGARLLELCLLEPPLGFIGGQYVIVDSGLVLPSGKAVKRAYSILGDEGEQQRFQIAVKRLPGGPGSEFLHEAAPGTVIKLSGPWGKLYPAEGASGRTLVLATDTGITAALGLLGGRRMAPLLPYTSLCWLRTSAGELLPDELVRARLPERLAHLEIATLPPVDHPDRIPDVRRRLRALLAAGAPDQAFLAGDGAVNYALLDDLVAAGVPATRDSVESFFNMPRKSAGPAPTPAASTTGA